MNFKYGSLTGSRFLHLCYIGWEAAGLFWSWVTFDILIHSDSSLKPPHRPDCCSYTRPWENRRWRAASIQTPLVANSRCIHGRCEVAVPHACQMLVGPQARQLLWGESCVTRQGFRSCMFRILLSGGRGWVLSLFLPHTNGALPCGRTQSEQTPVLSILYASPCKNSTQRSGAMQEADAGNAITLEYALAVLVQFHVEISELCSKTENGSGWHELNISSLCAPCVH